MTCDIGLGYYASLIASTLPYANGAVHLIQEPPEYNPLPGREIIGRPRTQGDGWEWDCVTRGEKGAQDFANACIPQWRKAGWCKLWIGGPNEPPGETVLQADLLSAFAQHMAPLAAAEGKLLMQGAFARGVPNPAILAHYVPMAQACGGRIAVHEYGLLPHAMDDARDVGSHCLRMKMIAGALQRAGIAPQIYVTETGGCGPKGGQGDGWLNAGVSSTEMARQLRWYLSECRKLGYVKAVIWFQASAFGWGSFAATGELLKQIAQINKDAPEVKPVETPVTPVVVPVVKPVTSSAKAYSQRDPHWINEPLGTGGGRTIGQAGCLVSAVASGLHDLGIETNPEMLNCWLSQHGGYDKGNLFIWSAVERLGVKLDQFINCATVAAPMGAIRDALAAGKVCIVELDSTPGGTVQPHFARVLAVSADGKDCDLMDPWQLPGGEFCKLSAHYEAPGWDAARAIFAVAVYRKV